MIVEQKRVEKPWGHEKIWSHFDWYNVEGPEDTIKLIRTDKAFEGGK